MDAQSDGQPARTRSPDSEILSVLHMQTGMLKAVIERLDALANLLVPAEKDGPSLNEILAELITVLKEQSEMLGRVDGRLTALGTVLPPVIAQEIIRATRNRDLHA